jgi:cation diffusion facilitator family transporter
MRGPVKRAQVRAARRPRAEVKPEPRSAEQPDTNRSIVYALAANLAITVVKFCGALFTGSGALLAESFHSLADSGNEVLLLLGRRQAKAPPSAHHPLGHGRASYFWSFVVALVLFGLGGVFSIVEGIRKLNEPAAVDSPWVAVAIVFFAMVAEGVSLRTVLHEVAKVRGHSSLWRWFRDTRRSELIVVLAEDLAAIVGLCLALAALLATIVTGNTAYDALGSVAIGVLLIVVASGLIIEIRSLLIGESASPKSRRAIRAFLQSRREIDELRGLVTMQLGEDLVIAVQAHMHSKPTAADLVKAVAQCKAALEAEFPQATRVFFEPVDAGDDKVRSLHENPRSS